MVFLRFQLRGSSTARGGSSPAGYTLIELVMTLVIVAVMAAIAIPHYGRSLARYQAEMAARRVASDLALARGTARTQSTNQKVDFSSPANGYTLTAMADPDHPASTYAVNLAGSPYKAAIVSATFGAGASASSAISFDRFGTPSAGGSVVVQSGDFQKTISVDGATGTVTIQ